MDALKNIKCGKSSGIDGISAEHFVFAHSRIHVLLSLLFSAFITHGYLPGMFMKTAIVPIIKNKTGDTSDKNNYRPIALVTATSKIFELCLSMILENYLFTHDQQFGFKSKHSTDFCIYTVKSVSKYYTQHHSPVYTCFLDASKAFDKINHWVQLGPRYEGQLNPMAEPIPHKVRPLVRTHVYHPYHAADRQAETDS